MQWTRLSWLLQASFFAIIELKASVIGTAQRMGLLQNGVEHRREIAGRRVDDLQHLGGRGLLLQGVPQLGFSAFQFGN